jgi:hypothetical protein
MIGFILPPMLIVVAPIFALSLFVVYLSKVPALSLLITCHAID